MVIVYCVDAIPNIAIVESKSAQVVPAAASGANGASVCATQKKPFAKFNPRLSGVIVERAIAQQNRSVALTFCILGQRPHKLKVIAPTVKNNTRSVSVQNVSKRFTPAHDFYMCPRKLTAQCFLCALKLDLRRPWIHLVAFCDLDKTTSHKPVAVI
jgi:hypothetical protein